MAALASRNEVPEHVGRVAVLLPRQLWGRFDCLDYLVASPVREGSYVQIPFGKTHVSGVVWGPAQGGVPDEKMRAIEGVSDLPPMPPALRQLVAWVSAYTLAPLGSVLRMALPVPAALVPASSMRAWAMVEKLPESVRMTPARNRVLAALAGKEGAFSIQDIAATAGVGTGSVRTMIKAGMLVEGKASMLEAPLSNPDPKQGPALSDAQRQAAGGLEAAVVANDSRPRLLDGVTGAGKTEVYFEAIAAAITTGKQALVLLPEIALGSQWVRRFEDRFGVPPGRWHSGVSASERRTTWRGIATGRVPVVVGARSSLFLPFPDLGVIVVDEEHDTSFKQETGVVYNARDMAVVRAMKEKCAVVLASATPSLESHVNACEERYRRLVLPARFGGAEVPNVQAIDLRKNPPPRGAWLSSMLVEEAKTTLDRGEQVLFFLNRRGYAPLTLCRKCGWRFSCPNCSAWLVDHRRPGGLLCHHCGHGTSAPSFCPSCDTTGTLTACGPGVERISEEVEKTFPEIKPAVMTSDTMTDPRDVHRVVEGMESGAIKVLIGTQMAAKGHHFPNLTLVGVVDADLGLSSGDLRAGERTYQLLTQVTGRAGRAERKGRVFLQTWNPSHPVMKAFLAHDRDLFLEEEAKGRRAAGMPPFGRLVALIISGKKLDRVESAARLLSRAAPQRDDVEVLGPAPAPLSRIRGDYRYRLLVRAGRDQRLQKYVRSWLEGVDLPSDVRVKVDVDPYSFL